MSSGIDKVYQTALVEAAQPAARNQAAAAYRTTYRMSTDELNLLETLINRPIIPNPTKESSHPVAAELLACANAAMDYNRKEHVIEIGPDPRWPNGEHPTAGHWTFANTDARDQARHIQHQLGLRRRKELKTTQQAFIDRVTRQSTNCVGAVCLGGLENCQHAADEAIAIHSLYDVTPRQVAQFMRHTGVKKITAVMHLPIELETPNAPPSTYYQTQLIQHGESTLLCMSFMSERTADTSHAYAHSLDNWRLYLTAPYWEAGDFNILIEHQKWQGVQATLTLTRVTKPGVITRNRLPSYMELARVPNYARIEQYGKRRLEDDILIPKWVANKTLSYLNSLPTTSHNVQAARTYLRSQTASMTIGTLLRFDTWRPDANVLEAAAVNLYMNSLAKRVQASQSLEDVTLLIKEDASLYHSLGHDYWAKATIKQLRRRLGNWWRNSKWMPDRGLTHPELQVAGQWLHHYTVLDNRPEVAVYTIPATTGCIGIFQSINPDKNVNCSLPWTEAFQHYLEGLRLSDHPAATRVYETMKDTQLPPIEAHITIIEGGPGTGKSQYIRRNHADATVIVPTQDLLKDYKNMAAYTTHVGILKTAHTVVVDEAYMQPLGFLACLIAQGAKRLILVGDPNQIGYIDFDHRGTEYALVNLPLPWERMSLNVTKRCPRDITWLLNHIFGYPKLHTTNNISRSIKLVKGLPKVTPADKTLVFTQEDKMRWHGSSTVHEWQGKTSRNVHLILTENARGLLSISRPHIVTALTRHTEQLYIYYENLDPAGFGISIPNAVDLEQVNLIPMTSPGATEPTLMESTPMEQLAPFGAPAEPTTINDALDKVTYGNIETYHTTLLTCIAPEEKIRVKALNIREDLKQQYHVRGKDYAHHTYVQDQITTATTLITRYAKKTLRNPEREWRPMVEEMVQRFKNSYLQDDIVPVPTGCEQRELIEMLKAMHQRGTLAKAEYQDICSPNVTVIDFHLKQQSKIKTAPEYSLPGHLRGKAGQGISAWSKTLNMMLGTAVRCVQRSIAHSVRPDVTLAYNASELQLGHKLKGDMRMLHTVESDITEFDCNQSPITTACEAAVWEGAGIDPKLIKLYLHIRANWKLSAYEIAELWGHDKQHSGQPATLFGNSLVTMFIMAWCYDGLDTAVCAFKGDDSIMLGEDIVLNSDNNKINDDTIGLTLKVQEGTNPQFINHFVTPQGLVPDYVRTAAKVCSKWFVQKPIHVKRSRKVVLVDNEISGKQVALLFGQPQVIGTLVTDGLIRAGSKYYSDAVVDSKVDLVRLNCHAAQIRADQLHVEYLPSLGRRDWRHLQCSLQHHTEKLYIHKHSTAILDIIHEYQRSIADRLRVHTVEQHQLAILAAANYYQLSTECVEAVYSTLKSMAHTHDPTQWLETRDNIPLIIEDIERRVEAIYQLPQQTLRTVLKADDRVNTQVRSVLKLDDFMQDTQHDVVIDIAAAPGSFSNALRNQGYEVQAWVFTGPGALKPSSKLLPKDSYKTYHDMTDIKIPEKPCHILSDASAVGNAKDENTRVRRTCRLMRALHGLFERAPSGTTYAAKINCPFAEDVRRIVNLWRGNKKIRRSSHSTKLSNEVIVLGHIIADERNSEDWGPALQQAIDDKERLPTLQSDLFKISLVDAGTDGNDCFHRAYQKTTGYDHTRQFLPTDRWIEIGEAMIAFNNRNLELAILVEQEGHYTMLTNGPAYPMIALINNHYYSVKPGDQVIQATVVRWAKEDNYDGENMEKECPQGSPPTPVPSVPPSGPPQHSDVAESGPARPPTRWLPADPLVNQLYQDMDSCVRWDLAQDGSDVQHWTGPGELPEQQTCEYGLDMELLPGGRGAGDPDPNQQSNQSSRASANVGDQRSHSRHAEFGSSHNGAMQRFCWSSGLLGLLYPEDPPRAALTTADVLHWEWRQHHSSRVSNPGAADDRRDSPGSGRGHSVHSEPGLPDPVPRSGSPSTPRNTPGLAEPLGRELVPDTQPGLFQQGLSGHGLQRQIPGLGFWDTQCVSTGSASDAPDDSSWSICSDLQHGDNHSPNWRDDHSNSDQHLDRRSVDTSHGTGGAESEGGWSNPSDQSTVELPDNLQSQPPSTHPSDDDEPVRNPTVSQPSGHSRTLRRPGQRTNLAGADGRGHNGRDGSLSGSASDSGDERPTGREPSANNTGPNRGGQFGGGQRSTGERFPGLHVTNCRNCRRHHPALSNIRAEDLPTSGDRYYQFTAATANDGVLNSGLPAEHLRQYHMKARKLGDVVTTYTPGLTVYHLVVRIRSHQPATNLLPYRRAWKNLSLITSNLPGHVLGRAAPDTDKLTWSQFHAIDPLQPNWLHYTHNPICPDCANKQHHLERSQHTPDWDRKPNYRWQAQNRSKLRSTPSSSLMMSL